MVSKCVLFSFCIILSRSFSPSTQQSCEHMCIWPCVQPLEGWRNLKVLFRALRCGKSITWPLSMGHWHQSFEAILGVLARRWPTTIGHTWYLTSLCPFLACLSAAALTACLRAAAPTACLRAATFTVLVVGRDNHFGAYMLSLNAKELGYAALIQANTSTPLAKHTRGLHCFLQ